MQRFIEASLLARLLPVLVLTALLGITPRPHLFDQSILEAQRALELGLPLQAAEALATAASRYPERAHLWEQAGQFALQGGDLFAAGAHFERALQAGDLSAQGLVSLGEAREGQGDLAGAIRAWEKALQAGGASEAVYDRLARAHQQLGDYPSAITDLKSWIDLDPGEAPLHYRLGLLLAATQPEASLAYLAQAAELDPTLDANVQAIQRSLKAANSSGDPAYRLVAAGQGLAALDEWELAGAAFQRAVQVRPDYAEAWAFLGEARQRLGSGGQSELQKAVQLDPDSVAANSFLALHWQRQGRPDLALDYLQRAAGLDSRNPALQAELGNTLAALGKISEALAYYQRAAELAPRDPAYWRSLAIFSVKYEFQVREVGLPAAQNAASLAEDDPASLDTLGQVYILLQEPASAERYLARALEINPNYAPAHLHLGLLFLLQGDRRPAREHLNLALALAPPDSPTADHAQRLLQQAFP